MVQLKTLGGLALEGSDFHRPKPLLLLAYLALEGGKDRRHLAELFWPEAADPMASLRTALAQLRSVGAGVVGGDATRLSAGVPCDARVLLEALEKREFADLEYLYPGSFLQGFYLAHLGAELEEWVYATREFLAAQVRAALLTLAERDAAAGERERAAGRAELAYRLPGAADPEPSEFERLYALLAAGDSGLAGEVAKAAKTYGLALRVTERDSARPADRAVLRAGVDTVPYRLPVPKTLFVGRDLELSELAAALSHDEVRLVTLQGPGGIGKTRLAMQTAAEQSEGALFGDGVYFVALDALTSPALIPGTIATTLSLGLTDDSAPLDGIIRAIGTKHVLVVLDNFEHLMTGAETVADLLAGCPNLKVIVTSRERLALEEEFVMTLQGLPVYARSDVSLADARALDAVQLFVQRAKRIRLDYTLSDADLPHVLDIARRVEGSPLGLELAAAWLKLLSPAEIAQALTRDLELLETSSRNISERHRSLRNVFAHSWYLLTSREQEAFRKLGVFQGGFSREAASEVAGVTIPVLAALVNKSLLTVGSSYRYTPHALLHGYMREKLADRPDEQAQTVRHHARYYVALAEKAAGDLFGSAEGLWLAVLAEEHDNLRAALGWAEAQGENELGLRLAAALGRFWLIQGHVVEGRDRLARLLELDKASAERAPAAVRAAALTAAAWLAHAHDDFRQATAWFEESAALRGRHDPMGSLTQLVNEAMRARAEGAYARATALLEESLARHRAVGNRQSIRNDGVGLSLARLGLVLTEQGRYARAAELYGECLLLHQTLGDRGGVAATLLGLSDVARDQGEVGRLRSLCEACLSLFRDLGEQWGVGFTLNNLALAAYTEGSLPHAAALAAESLTVLGSLKSAAPSAEVLATVGRIALARGDRQRAGEALTESLTLAWARGPRWLVAVNLEGCAELLLEDQPWQAAELLGAAAALRTAMGAPLPPFSHADHERVHEQGRAVLGADAWQRASEAGSQTKPEQAVSVALSRAELWRRARA